ncbi:MAG: hypothetical protein U0175_31170 [Caldilineaceae bacterium]
MRKLSDNFLECLKTGFLSPMIETVRSDLDLSLDIRENYINIYYKGNSLLQLSESSGGLYRAQIHPKFLTGIAPPVTFTEETVPLFLQTIPQLKQNIVGFGKRSLEIEYEQLIIRANNLEIHNNTDYFIVDRQYTVADGRFDLLGFCWATKGRKRYQEVPISLIEIKFALNSEIQSLHEQVERYYAAIKPKCAEIADELQTIFRQKLELGLYQQPQDRLAAMATLKFARTIEQFQFLIILVDYNHNSSLLSLQNLERLPFANQIRIFHSGFAMWQQNAKTLSGFLSKEF